MIPLISKEDMARSRRVLTKLKRPKYGNLKKRVMGLIPWINTELSKSSYNDITVKVRDIAEELRLSDKSDTTIYAGLRYLLFFEGINVSIMNNGLENHLVMMPIHGYGYGLPDSAIKEFENVELDGWYFKRSDSGISIKHSIRKSIYKDKNGNDMYMLESDGDIYFDRRDLTDEQTVEFVKYISSGDIEMPDMIRLTPINVVIPDEFVESDRINPWGSTDFDKIGREFRIVGSGSGPEFTVTSIYGKECTIYEHDIDEIVKRCSIRGMLYDFDKALIIEKLPERIEILKKILPEIKTRYAWIIKDSKLTIANSSGNFQLSLTDGTLHKIYGEIDRDGKCDNKYKYICVGPSRNTESFIVFDGVKYGVDMTMGVILAKAVMLLEERYPDERTLSQIRN